jgi:hypothetical protein
MTPDWVVPVATVLSALAAWVALVISIYNAYTQRKNRLPTLMGRVDTDRRNADLSGGAILSGEVYSCQIVNDGSVPVEVRSVRLFVNTRFFDRFGKGSGIPFPQADDSIEPVLLKNEHRFPVIAKSVEKVLPIMLQPSDSVRFATWEDSLKRDLRSAGFFNRKEFRVGVLDQRDKWHTVESSVDLGPPPPAQQSPVP